MGASTTIQDALNSGWLAKAVQDLEKGKTSSLSPMHEWLRKILSDMLLNAEAYDLTCNLSDRKYGQGFGTLLQGLNAQDFPSVQEFFCVAFEFSCERELHRGFDRAQPISHLRSEVLAHLSSFDPSVQRAVLYASTALASDVVKLVLQGDGMAAAMQFIADKRKIDTYKDGLHSNLDNVQKRISSLDQALQRHEQHFNFMELNVGFDNLKKSKEQELTSHLHSLKRLGATLLVVPLVALLFHLVSIGKDSELSWHVLSSLPFIGLELVLIYFFRVILANYQSIRGQLLQIDLRKTLCQFIQGYSKYAAEIGKNSKGSLDRFESIIFSNLTADPQQIPSTFDCLDQIAKGASTLRGK